VLDIFSLWTGFAKKNCWSKIDYKIIKKREKKREDTKGRDGKRREKIEKKRKKKREDKKKEIRFG
jgi:hypothetical protein